MLMLREPMFRARTSLSARLDLNQGAISGMISGTGGANTLIGLVGGGSALRGTGGGSAIRRLSVWRIPFDPYKQL